MAITHTIQSTWSGSSGAALGGAIANTGSSECNLSLAMLASQTDTVQSFAVPVLTTAQKSFYILSTVACTIKFYAGATLKTTLVLAANTPLLYQGAGTSPIDASADLTQIKYTTTTAGQLEVRFLLT